MKRLLIALALGAALAGCAHTPPNAAGGIGIVDVARLRENWPKFKADDEQLAAATHALEASNAPAAEKERRRTALRARFQKMQDDVTGDVRRAAGKVAEKRGLRLVLTQESVGYGGTDVTADVEKVLGITERHTP